MSERLMEELRGIVGEDGLLVEEPDLLGFSHDETASEKIRALPRAASSGIRVGCGPPSTTGVPRSRKTSAIS